MVLLSAGFRAEGHVVVEGFPDVLGFEAERGGPIGPPDRVFPEVEMSENLLDRFVMVNQRNQPHLAAAFRTEQRVNIPCFLDQLAPSARGDFAADLGEWGRQLEGSLASLRMTCQPFGTRPAGFVAVIAVVFYGLRAFFGDVLRNGGEKVGSGEDLEIAAGGRVQSGMVDDPAAVGNVGHLLHGEGMTEDVLGQIFEFGAVVARHWVAAEKVESAVFPLHELMHERGREHFSLDQEPEDPGSKQATQGAKCGAKQRDECSGPVEQAVGGNGMDVGMEIEIVAKGVQREHDPRHAVSAVHGGAHPFDEAVIGQPAEIGEQGPVSLEETAHGHRQAEHVMAMGHVGENFLDQNMGGLDGRRCWQLGQNPRVVQLKAKRYSKRQSGQRTRAKP